MRGWGLSMSSRAGWSRHETGRKIGQVANPRIAQMADVPRSYPLVYSKGRFLRLG